MRAYQTAGLYAFHSGSRATRGIVWRQRRVVQDVRARSHAVFAERIRLARELHHRLLSDMAGVVMRLDALASQAARDLHLAVSVLPELRDQARRTLDETQLIPVVPPVTTALLPSSLRVMGKASVEVVRTAT